MYFKLVFATGIDVETTSPCNAGYDHQREVGTLTRLAEEGHGYVEISSARLTEQGRADLIADARTALSQGSAQGRVFGSDAHPWTKFGTGVPALLVYDDGDCIGVYPHKTAAGLETIAEYLATLGADT